jgi:hypothetical protein
MQPVTRGTPAHVGATEKTTIRCLPYAHLPQPGQCSDPLHLTFLVINVEHLLHLFPGEFSAPPPSSPFYDWMVNNITESFFGALCVSWVFYRDAQKRDDRGDTVYHPQFFARVSGQTQDAFIMRMTSDWFEAAWRYTDSSSLGRCVHHVRGPMIKKTPTTIHTRRLGVRSVAQISCVGTLTSSGTRAEEPRDRLLRAYLKHMRSSLRTPLCRHPKMKG